ncbi:SDR family NAD(P)-dependent oxidoreductase [Sanguibacter sp. 25GB23B1]|uniref:SDR family NAD(P)-dependent oxidoreductase n=1 Tax=unclassified Sanguibacter TaxID=2645534 RepID=UPI0032AFC004
MRTVVVTGSASGIGKALAETLAARGDRVVGVDLHDADITVDLTSPQGRSDLVRQVTDLTDGVVDAVVANAGLAHPTPATVAVNYFGTIATLDGLRPLLAASTAPRAVATGSMASIMPSDPELVDLCLTGDESGALARAQVLADTDGGSTIYSSTKVALARWVRRNAPTAEWAGAGIPLNAIAPGIVETPMVADLLATEEQRTQMAALVPMPLHGYMSAQVPADLLAWLVSTENTHLCGQVVFVDGGSDVVLRGDSTW